MYITLAIELNTNRILQRSLVMDYLCHQCYTRTAIAFAKDGTVRHLDADGDEIVQPKEEGIFAGRDALELSKETLREAELRNGGSFVCWYFCLKTYFTTDYEHRYSSQDSLWES
jgi:hypothetical protein